MPITASLPAGHDRSEVQFALDAVQRASQLATVIQKEMVAPALAKPDRSPVTVADFASQALIGRILEQTFPDIPLVAEEETADLTSEQGRGTLEQVTGFLRRLEDDADTDRVCRWIQRGTSPPDDCFWTLDPIDGTKGFLRGDQYAVALALLEHGRVRIGVMGCPHITDGCKPDKNGPGSLIVAVRGRGAWTTSLAGNSPFQRLKVSNILDPTKCRVLRSLESGHTNGSQIDMFANILGVRVDPIKMDSQAKYGLLAAGKGDLLLRLITPARPDYKERIWDQAAGAIVVEEAGGSISDLDGKALDFSHGRTLAVNRGVVASNGLLHDTALATLRAMRA